ncbi:MAG: hypothetical protein M3033_15310 [Acidobacteriota bacterium]|nr:hypothetical protein [Acidobacteriota bacterium]
MPEKPKRENDKAEKDKKSAGDECETGGKDSPSREQREKSYYYDDSHGYEIYNPEDDDEKED